MAQLTLYIPDDVAKELREKAQQAGKSLSAYVVEALRSWLRPEQWPPGWLELFGSWEGPFPDIEELPFEEREKL